jgi:hypothetical protein
VSGLAKPSRSDRAATPAAILTRWPRAGQSEPRLRREVARAEAQSERDQAHAAGEETGELDALNGELDEEITRSGVRGKVLPARTARRHRSTRRRQDAPDLPRRKVAPRTIGKDLQQPGRQDVPALDVHHADLPQLRARPSRRHPSRPRYLRLPARARDALHFAALFDRFIQNLRRFLGYDVQYFAAVEPQRRLAPHVHIAVRGTLSRTELRQVLAATYHQVWWPPASDAKYHDGELPVWHEASGNYLDPATGELCRIRFGRDPRLCWHGSPNGRSRRRSRCWPT